MVSEGYGDEGGTAGLKLKIDDRNEERDKSIVMLC